MSTELLVIEKFNLELVPFFTKGDRLDELLAAIKVEVMAHVPDVSNPKGRTLIKNNITAAKKYRTHLESSGKALSAEYKLIPSAIDATRKKVNDFLLDVESKARESLTAWEVIDKAEKKQIADTAAYLIKFAADLDEGCRDNELFDLKAKQAELERQAEIKAAAETARIQAEGKAAGEIKQAKIDKEKAEADARFAAAAAADAKWLTYISEAYAHNDQLTAAKSARDAVLRSQREEDERIAKAKAAREADLDNRHAKNVAAKNAIVELGFNSLSATALVKAIAKGLIPGVTINY